MYILYICIYIFIHNLYLLIFINLYICTAPILNSSWQFNKKKSKFLISEDVVESLIAYMYLHIAYILYIY